MGRFLSSAVARQLQTVAKCGWIGQGLIGHHAATLYNVSDAQACQRQCQMYSNVAFISGCAEHADLPATVCVGVNFSGVDGRCTLLGEVEAVVPAADFTALPVLCKSQQNFQIQSVSELDQLKTNATVWSCLQENDIKPVITNETRMSMESWPGHTFDYKDTLRSHVVDILKAYSPLPSLENAAGSSNVLDMTSPSEDANDEDISSEDAPADESLQTGVARRLANLSKMPRITADVTNVTEGIFYQTANVLAQPSSTLSSLPMVYPRGVEDWRECALLCDISKPQCVAWSFLYNPAQSSGGCYLATSAAYPTVLNTSDNSLKSISGLAFDSLPQYLFGQNAVADTPSDSSPATMVLGESLHPECHPVDYPGFLFRTLNDTKATVLPTNLYTLGATNLEYCSQACSTTNGCVAYQFVPGTVAEASSFLQSMITEAGSNCMLFSALGEAPVLHAADPLAGTGFLSCGTEKSKGDQIPIAQWMTATETQLPDTKLKQNVNYLSETKNTCTSSSPWSEGWAIKGTLMSTQANLIKGIETSADCDDYCRNVQDCEGWTFGSWKSCYLYNTIEAYVEDSDCVSGQLKCTRALSAETVTNSTTASSSNQRDIDSCDRSRKNAYYKSGHALETAKESSSKSANECFRLCRTTSGCNYMSWFPEGFTLEGTDLKEPKCVLLSDVKDVELLTPAEGAYSSEMICDAMGRAVSKENQLAGELDLDVKTPLWIAIGGVGGASIVIGSLVAYIRFRKPAIMEEPSCDESLNLSRLILNTSSFHGQMSQRLSFQSEIQCEVDNKPLVLTSKTRPLVRFADTDDDEDDKTSNAPYGEPGTCITMRTEESASSPPPCIDEILGVDLQDFQPHTVKTQKRAARE